MCHLDVAQNCVCWVPRAGDSSRRFALFAEQGSRRVSTRQPERLRHILDPPNWHGYFLADPKQTRGSHVGGRGFRAGDYSARLVRKQGDPGAVEALAPLVCDRLHAIAEARPRNARPAHALRPREQPYRQSPKDRAHRFTSRRGSSAASSSIPHATPDRRGARLAHAIRRDSGKTVTGKYSRLRLICFDRFLRCI